MKNEIVALSRVRWLGREGEARRIREASGLSVRELAQALKVDPATLSRWETGRSSPRRKAAIRWGATLADLADIAERRADGDP